MFTTTHRFTPPTCTLEVKGRKLPLSRWTKPNILKKLQFKLKFDDPGKPNAKQIVIEGNEHDLSRLQTAVNYYVVRQLQPSPSTDNQLEFAPTTKPKSNISGDRQPYLESQGLIYHKLFFGSLTHDSNLDHLKLGTVQLFDLVDALEAYQTQVAVLPQTQSASFSKKVIPLWGGIAAAAIAVIGLSTILLKPSPQSNTASLSRTQTKPQTKIPELDEITPPSAPAKQTVPKPKLTEPISSAKKLPPPPAVDVPKPKPDIPDPADYRLSDVARQSGFNNSQPDKASPNSSSESIIIVPTEQESPITPLKQDESTSPQINQENFKSNVTDGLSNESEASDRAQKKQIREVVNYFQEKWQPPADLKQSLEYRLMLNADGTIKKVVPLGKASRLYLSQTNIPVNLESFISPLTEAEPLTIRLLLSPDGGVQAFTE